MNQRIIFKIWKQNYPITHTNKLEDMLLKEIKLCLN